MDMDNFSGQMEENIKEIG